MRIWECKARLDPLNARSHFFHGYAGADGAQGCGDIEYWNASQPEPECGVAAALNKAMRIEAVEAAARYVPELLQRK